MMSQGHVTQNRPISVQSWPIKGRVSSNKLRNCVFLTLITPCPLIFLGLLMVSWTEKWHIYTKKIIQILVQPHSPTSEQIQDNMKERANLDLVQVP